MSVKHGVSQGENDVSPESLAVGDARAEATELREARGDSESDVDLDGDVVSECESDRDEDLRARDVTLSEGDPLAEAVVDCDALAEGERDAEGLAEGVCDTVGDGERDASPLDDGDSLGLCSPVDDCEEEPLLDGDKLDEPEAD